MYMSGLLTTGSCCVVFGMLDFFHSHDWFMGLSFVVRSVEAIGNSAFLCASFSLIAQEFPDRVKTASIQSELAIRDSAIVLKFAVTE